jgi:hypothetical protein
VRRLALAAALAALALPGAAHAAAEQESTFQDDPRLVYGDDATVASTLDTLKALGVDRLRISLFWRVVAPAPADTVKPGGFDAARSETYPNDAWARYDRLLREARARGLAVNLNVTGPAPNWATGEPPADRPDLDETWRPDRGELEQFVRAAGRRYDGTFLTQAGGEPLPRVDFWSIWNEPNQGGWLTPQWDGELETSPRLYRDIVAASWDALQLTGHGADTILIGETAPKGLRVKGPTRAMNPGRFIRRLFCVDDRLAQLTGPAAEAQGCPADGSRDAFVSANPGLFAATGWGHHPYELTFAPSRRPTERDWFTVANLGDLSRLLDRVQGRAVPLYITEYGYQTRPPDPTGVTVSRQAAYLNEAEYLTWRNSRVRSHAQFLLVDDGPVPGLPLDSVAAWGSSFQTGLMTLAGKAKPALRTYKLAAHLPDPHIRAGSRLLVWGLARSAPGTPVEIQIRPRGARAFRTVGRVRPTPQGYLRLRVRPSRSGTVRLRQPGLASRTMAFSVRPTRRAAARRGR